MVEVQLERDGTRSMEWLVREPDANGIKHDGKRFYRSSATTHDVECKDCEFYLDGRNGLGLAAQHHDRTGHHVIVWSIRTIEYL